MMRSVNTRGGAEDASATLPWECLRGQGNLSAALLEGLVWQVERPTVQVSISPGVCAPLGMRVRPTGRP